VDRLIRQRLANHKLLQSDLREPGEVVAWLGAVQSQDFAGAKWTVGQRSAGLTHDAVEHAYNAGSILRTHVLRPTWHFVTPADIGWMLTLTAPRVHQFNAYYYRQLELDARTLSKARTLLSKALEGGAQLTRAELASALKRGRIVASGPRLGVLTMDAELNQVMCSGAMRGKQFTYARFDSRVPRTRTWTREEMLAELTRRYFTSHGPATLKDFAWWSGLTMREVKTGIELVKPHIVSEAAGDLTYWSVPSNMAARRRISFAGLLPTFDEYLIAYKDRGLALRSSRPIIRVAFTSHVIIDGLRVGSWRPTVARGEIVVDVNLDRRAPDRAERAVQQAAIRYGRFLGKPVTVR